MVSIDWSRKFRSWRRPLGSEEKARCERALRMVKEAIHQSPALATHKVKIREYGSYLNNTNLRTVSDIDIYVCYVEAGFWRTSWPRKIVSWLESVVNFLRSGKAEPLPLHASYSAFKGEVEKALSDSFGRSAVRRRRKAIGVKENSGRIGADVIACFEHRRLFARYSGIEFWSDNGEHIISWPEQHHENGKTKYRKTQKKYKFAVRILKRLKYRMVAEGIPEASEVSSYLIECLVWNVPNRYFRTDQYLLMIRNILTYLRKGSLNEAHWEKWKEVNGCKRLTESQRWRASKVRRFVDAAWLYLGFERVTKS